MDLVWYVLGVIAIVLGLGLAIGLHEIGHLYPAKKFGVKVTQYMLGFGPTLWSKKKGETEYGIKAIPLGGYVSMIGMYPPKKQGEKAKIDSTGFFQGMIEGAREASAETVTEGDEERTFYNLPVGKRLIIMLGGPMMNLLLGIVFLSILVVGFGMPKSTTTLGVVNECVIPVSASSTTCTPDAPESPGAAAGLMPGDTVLEFAGELITSWDHLSSLIRETTTSTQIVIERDGFKHTLEVTPMVTDRPVFDEQGQPMFDAEGEYVLAPVGFLGIGSKVMREPQPITDVFPVALETVTQVGKAIVTIPQRLYDTAVSLFSDQERDPNGLISVVGVGMIAGEVVSHGDIEFGEKVAWLLGVLASLNFMLFAFNLIPLPPLDGGHVAGGAWELVKRGFARLRGRPDPGPVDTAKLMPVTMVMFVLLMGMGAFLILADLIKPINLF